jgi:hypothetical protein
MGGYVVTIAETANFRWEIHVSLSDAFPRHWFGVCDKRDESRWIDMRTTGAEGSNQSQNDAFDEALDELQKEAEGNRQYAMLTKDQLTLATLWERMNDAQKSEEHYRKMTQKYEELFYSLKVAWDSIERARSKPAVKGETDV